MSLRDLIVNDPKYIQRFNSAQYPALFRQYASLAAPAFDALSADALSRQAGELLDQLQQEWDGIRWKSRRKIAQNDARLFCAVYLAPAALERGGIAADFVRELCRQWGQRWPDAPFQIGSYEQIMSGFRNIFGFPVKR